MNELIQGCLQMETFHIFHLAASWQGKLHSPMPVPPPLTTSPVHPDMSQPSSIQDPPLHLPSSVDEDLTSGPKIKAAAAQMVFASRSSQDFITPEQVTELESWCARGVLEALREFEIGSDVQTSLSLEPPDMLISDFIHCRTCTPRLVVFGR
jgi:uridine phosphorylase